MVPHCLSMRLPCSSEILEQVDHVAIIIVSWDSRDSRIHWNGTPSADHHDILSSSQCHAPPQKELHPLCGIVISCCDTSEIIVPIVFIRDKYSKFSKYMYLFSTLHTICPCSISMDKLYDTLVSVSNLPPADFKCIHVPCLWVVQQLKQSSDSCFQWSLLLCNFTRN